MATTHLDFSALHLNTQERIIPRKALVGLLGPLPQLWTNTVPGGRDNMAGITFQPWMEGVVGTWSAKVLKTT